ncbi:MAG: helix-turn-helix transcriptional regulator [Candidatus Woesearchaeota archaeon]
MRYLVSICICILFISVLISNNAYGARIYGAIYDHNLEPIQRTVVMINSTPEQRHVSIYGGYAFSVPPGSYLITAELTLNDVTRPIAEQYITVVDDNEYKIDLFIFDHIDLTQDFEPPSRFTTIITNTSWILGGMFIVFVSFYGIRYWYRKLKYNRLKTDTAQKQPPQDDGYKQKIISLVQQADGSITQRHIRKSLPISEAKVSLLISELEKEGVLRKEKQGRVNVLRLQNL